jgi:ABC transporter substrate binding protein
VWRSLVAHLLWEQGAGGSNPLTPTIFTTSVAHPVRVLCGNSRRFLLTSLTGVLATPAALSAQEVGKKWSSLERPGRVLVAWGTIVAVAAKEARVSCPVVFSPIGFPVAIGMVSSLNRPDGNFTGISFEAADETYGKQVAPRLGIAVIDTKVRNVTDLELAFAEMRKKRAQAVLVIAGAFMFANREPVAGLAITHHLPSVHGLHEGVAAGRGRIG